MAVLITRALLFGVYMRPLSFRNSDLGHNLRQDPSLQFGLCPLVGALSATAAALARTNL